MTEGNRLAHGNCFAELSLFKSFQLKEKIPARKTLIAVAKQVT